MRSRGKNWVSAGSHVRALVIGGSLLTAAWSGQAAVAAEPAQIAAIVEAAEGTETELTAFSYVRVGDRIELGMRGRVVLGYLASCIQETARGGTLTVGLESGVVIGGEVERRRVECDGSNLKPTAAQEIEAGVTVLREIAPESNGVPHVDLTIYGTQPLVQLPAEARALTWKRLDRPEPSQTIENAQRMIDFSALGKQLTRGGLYAMEVSPSKRLVVRVHKAASSGATPLLGRLVPLGR